VATNPAFERWTACHAQAAAAGTELMWPSETLVRLFKGDYVPGLDKAYAGKRVIDVGFGGGNNLVFLGTLGLALHGTEVTEELCATARGKLARLGYAADLRVGTNRQLPFPDATFDFLVSWNVVHYEDDEKAIREAIAEYRRVLRPGGRLFASTTGPDHMILRDAETLGGHRYRIGRADDFRKGQVFFYFDAPNYVDHYFSEHFAEVRVGRTRDALFTETLDWFIVTGVRA
jgi:SAM-dependent methyltransferase